MSQDKIDVGNKVQHQLHRWKILLIIVAVWGLSSSLYAQDLKPTTNQNGQMGYADSKGKIIIQCKYDAAYPFIDGIAKINKNGKYGYINASGKFVIPAKYDYIQPWGKDLFCVRTKKKYGLIDKHGNNKLSVKYTYISDPNCYGKAWFALGGKINTSQKGNKIIEGAKIGIIDNKGNVNIAPKFKYLYEFSKKTTVNNIPFGDGKMLAPLNYAFDDTLNTDCKYMGYTTNAAHLGIEKAGIIDENGKEIIKKGVYTWVMCPTSGMIRYYKSNPKNWTMGYYNLATHNTLDVITLEKNADLQKGLRYISHGDFTGNIAPVNNYSQSNNWSFINKRGEKVLTGFSDVQYSKDFGLWLAKKDEKCLMIDEKGNIKAENNYSEIRFSATPETDKLLSVKKDSLWGLIDNNDRTILPCQYEDALGVRYGWMPVKQNGKWGYVRIDGTVVIPCEFKEVALIDSTDPECVWVLKDDMLWYNYNVSNNNLGNKGYLQCSNFANGFAWVKPKNLIVENNAITQAMINTVAKNTSSKDFSVEYVIVVGEDNQVYYDWPIPQALFEKVVDIINTKYKRPLTKAEMKRVGLYITRDVRSYPLNETIRNENWDF